MKRIALWRTDLGWMAAVIEGGRLRRLALPRRGRSGALAALGDAVPEGAAVGDPPAALRRALERYFRGGELEPVLIPDPEGGTPFQRRVWRACARIPRGETRTYGWLAARAGSPGAARAVGRAMGANPLPLFVP